MNTKNILYFLIFPGLILQFIGAYFYFVAFQGAHLFQIMYILTKILIIILPIYWIIKKEKHVFSQNHKNSILIGILTGLGIATIILSLFAIFFDYFSQFTDDITTKVENLGIIAYYIPFAIFLSIVHSGIEEYYWRWFIFRGLQIKFRPVVAAIISSVGFASHHFIVLYQLFNVWLTILFGIAVFVGGLIWCSIYNKTNSPFGNWVSHILVDLAIMTVGYLLIF